MILLIDLLRRVFLSLTYYGVRLYRLGMGYSDNKNIFDWTETSNHFSLDIEFEHIIYVNNLNTTLFSKVLILCFYPMDCKFKSKKLFIFSTKKKISISKRNI